MFHSSQFRWNKGKGSATVGELGLDRFPKDSFVMKSDRTGETRTFYYDHGRMEAMEFFDGEACAYISSCDRARVEIWC